MCRRFKAMQKFLGACVANVEVRAAMFQVHAAIQSKYADVFEISEERDASNK